MARFKISGRASQGKMPKKMPNAVMAIGKGKPVLSGEKKKHRYKAGTIALREIRKYQKTTELLTTTAPFRRWVKQCERRMSRLSEFVNYKQIAIQMLHTAMEAKAIELLEASNQIAIHAKRITVKPRDIDLAFDLQNKSR